MRSLHPAAKGLFITGTDTEVGKTWVGSRLAGLLTRNGIAVAPRKPVESGCKPVDGTLLPSDALQYFQAIDKRESLEAICPYRYASAVAPDLAARHAGKTLSLEALTAACQCNENDFLMVEGAGGFYSPIAENSLNADLAQTLGLPLLLVAADRLGCQNHVLLTLEAISRRGLRTMAIVLNRTSAAPGDFLRNKEALREKTPVRVFSIPHDPVSAKDLESLASFIQDRA